MAIQPSTDLSRDLVLSKCKAFSDFQVWPLTPRLNPEAWLSNFDETEQPFALHLLNGFMFFSDAMVDQLLTAAFQNLSNLIPQDGSARSASWVRFCEAAIVTHVTGEEQHSTDSGHLFARKARDVLGFQQKQILSNEEAVAALRREPGRPLLLVDDFVGSGKQLITTWRRRLGKQEDSFEAYFREHAESRAYYCPTICTEHGLGQIETHAPFLTVSPGNLLSQRYSVFHPESLVWPADMVATGPAFVRRASQRAGIPADGSRHDLHGVERLGLSLAFHHSVPDATIPLLHWNQNGWWPLVRKS